jgi:hypothetical protein
MIFFAGLATGFLLGGIAFGIFALLLLVHKRAPGITMNARKPVDVPCQERKYRGKETTVVVPSWEREEVGGIDYRFMGVGNEEV